MTHQPVTQVQAPRVPVLKSDGMRHRTPRPPSGDQSVVEPPGPIPNPEVKRRSADGSETIGLVRVGRRQVYARPRAIGAGLFFCAGGRAGFQPVMDDGFEPVDLLAGTWPVGRILPAGRCCNSQAGAGKLFYGLHRLDETEEG